MLPRPADAAELAREIDAVFSSGERRAGLLASARRYVAANTWDAAAGRYEALLRGLARVHRENTVYVNTQA